VFATVHLWHSVRRLHRLLRALERRGQLVARARVSLCFYAQLDPQQPSATIGVPAVVALDLVERPAIRDAGLIRSLSPDEYHRLFREHGQEA
jgi:hypothetical protein